MMRSEKGSLFSVGQKTVLPSNIGQKTRGAVRYPAFIYYGRSAMWSVNGRFMTDFFTKNFRTNDKEQQTKELRYCEVGQ